jgi:hypothetical protein
VPAPPPPAPRRRPHPLLRMRHIHARDRYPPVSACMFANCALVTQKNDWTSMKSRVPRCRSWSTRWATLVTRSAPMRRPAVMRTESGTRPMVAAAISTRHFDHCQINCVTIPRHGESDGGDDRLPETGKSEDFGSSQLGRRCHGLSLFRSHARAVADGQRPHSPELAGTCPRRWLGTGWLAPSHRAGRRTTRGVGHRSPAGRKARLGRRPPFHVQRAFRQIRRGHLPSGPGARISSCSCPSRVAPSSEIGWSPCHQRSTLEPPA